MSVWMEMFSVSVDRDPEAPLARDWTIHPLVGRALNPPGYDVDNKQVAIDIANRNSSTHLRFYSRGGRFSYLKRAELQNGDGLGDAWRHSDADEFLRDLGLEEPQTLAQEDREGIQR